jgi:hypothetical protein
MVRSLLNASQCSVRQLRPCLPALPLPRRGPPRAAAAAHAAVPERRRISTRRCCRIADWWERAPRADSSAGRPDTQAARVRAVSRGSPVPSHSRQHPCGGARGEDEAKARRRVHSSAASTWWRQCGTLPRVHSSCRRCAPPLAGRARPCCRRAAARQSAGGGARQGEGAGRARTQAGAGVRGTPSALYCALPPCLFVCALALAAKAELCARQLNRNFCPSLY